MEELLQDNMYVIDLGNINSAPEIIFELSSVLDRDEAKNKRICLKLGDVNLNQAQLLSIKSLINGIDSVLSCLDTKSVETEKTALSLGIIISNVSQENTLEVIPETPYKTAEEFKESIQNMQNDNLQSAQATEEQNIPHFENPDEPQDKTETVMTEECEKGMDIAENDNNFEHITEEQCVCSFEETIEDNAESTADKLPSNNEIKDELEVIFGSDPLTTNVFEIPESAKELYEKNESLSDIVVPEQEYTKEDIELEEFPTKYIKQTIRSGQVINYEGNIVIIGDCHIGCEVSALGDITVWGILSGIAHAGSGGNRKARVRALKMNAIQLRIANCYSRRPDSLNTVYVEKTNSYIPEEARIVNSEIVVFKIND